MKILWMKSLVVIGEEKTIWKQIVFKFSDLRDLDEIWPRYSSCR